MKRKVLVTGASSGIGLAVVRHLLREQYAVFGVSRNCRQLSFNHDDFHPIELDLAKLDELPQKLRDLQPILTTIDSAIFCAGSGRFGSLEEFSYDQIEMLMALNFTSQAFLARALLPFLKTKTYGNLIFIGSEAALRGSRKGAIYCASKFAIRGFSQALREECSKSGVSVCLINPGMVRTPFFEQLTFEPGDDPSNYIEASDVADAVAYVLNCRSQTVIDEINLSPLNKVIKFKIKP